MQNLNGNLKEKAAKLGKVIELDKPSQEAVRISLNEGQAAVVFYALSRKPLEEGSLGVVIVDEDHLSSIGNAHNQLSRSNDGFLHCEIFVFDKNQNIGNEIKTYLRSNKEKFSDLSSGHFDFNNFEQVFKECGKNDFTVTLGHTDKLEIKPVTPINTTAPRDVLSQAIQPFSFKKTVTTLFSKFLNPASSETTPLVGSVPVSPVNSGQSKMS